MINSSFPSDVRWGQTPGKIERSDLSDLSPKKAFLVPSFSIARRDLESQIPRVERPDIDLLIIGSFFHSARIQGSTSDRD